MLVAIGIVILIISFVVALVSLIAEERKRVKPSVFSSEDETKEESKVNKEDKLEQVKKVLEEEKKREEKAQIASGEAHEPFPWETGIKPAAGGHVSQHTSDEDAQNPDYVNIPLSDARFSNISDEQKPLSGTFRIGDISKKED